MAQRVEYHESFPLFGKDAEITIFDIDKPIARDLAYGAFLEGVRLHQIFNYHDETSELSILNRKRNMIVSAELLLVLRKAIEVCRLTGGRYDISLGKTIDRIKKGLPAGKANAPTYKDILIKENCVELKGIDAKIDLGSLAKGYITDKMMAHLKTSGVLSGIIDSRGDIRVFGKIRQEISVQHPREDGFIDKILVKNQGIATSGDYSQYYKTYENSHIFNKSGFISVTAVAKTLMDADLAATAMMVLSLKSAEEFALKIGNPMLAIDSQVKKHYYNGFEKLRT